MTKTTMPYRRQPKWLQAIPPTHTLRPLLQAAKTEVAQLSELLAVAERLEAIQSEASAPDLRPSKETADA